MFDSFEIVTSSLWKEKKRYVSQALFSFKDDQETYEDRSESDRMRRHVIRTRSNEIPIACSSLCPEGDLALAFRNLSI